MTQETPESTVGGTPASGESASEIVKVIYDGIAIDVPAAYTREDALLLRVMAPFWEGAADAQVQRNADGTITLIKRARPKGADPILDMLIQLPEHANPVIQLYYDMQLRKLNDESLGSFEQLRQQIAAAVRSGRLACAQVNQAMERLKRARPKPVHRVPEGF